MDFFASQDLARRKTKWLILYLILAVVCMIAGIYLVVLLAFGGFKVQQEQSLDGFQLFDPVILALVAVLVVSFVSLGSLFKIAQLRGGGENIASMLGGRRLPPNSRDATERRILNVVEEVALAAGTPVPPVYLLDKEQGINAFAAGYTVDDAVIGINRGTLEQLNRDELQGVIAHEFSHILNGDMRMSIRLIGILHGIQVLALAGYFLLRSASYGSGRSRDKGGAAILITALGVIVIGSIGLLFARLIKASVSRQREYLADASAVQFTRNPEGIGGALKMIGASQFGSQVESPQAEQASHMFFASMFGSGFGGLFSTHPPLVKRIQAVDPRFSGDFSDYVRTRKRRLEKAAREKEPKRSAAGRFPKTPGARILPAQIGDHFPLDPAILIAAIGSPTPEHVEYARAAVDQIPPAIGDAARELFSARCIVFAALLDDTAEVTARQVEMLHKRQGAATVDETMKLARDLEKLEPRLRLPVFEIVQGTLAGFSPEQYVNFRETVNLLVEADQRISLFEFFLRHHLITHLDRRYSRKPPISVRFHSLTPLKRELELLLGVLARVGHAADEEAQQAMAAALQAASLDPESAANVPADWNPRSLTDAIQKLSQASPAVKKRALSAAAVAVTFDRQVTVEEAELFRAFSEALECPVPPIIATA